MRLLITLFFLSYYSICFPQNNDSISVFFNNIESQYNRKKINDTVYMAKVKEFSYEILAQGIYIQPKKLRKYLALYEKIAFSNKKYQRYRINYHTFFFNNASLFDKRGEAMYFAEKVTKEYALQNQHSLMESTQKCRIFVKQTNLDKLIETYNKEKDYLFSIPYLLSKDSIKPRVALDAFSILSPVSAGYCSLGDSVNLSKIHNLSLKIVNELKKKNLDNDYLLSMDMQLLEQKFFKSFVIKDYKTCSAALNEVEKLKTKYKGKANTDILNYSLTEWKIDFYTRTNKIDSAEYYLKKYNDFPQLTQDIKERILAYSAEVDFIKGNYKDAYLKMQKANVVSDSLKTNLTDELDDLLYSYTKAEDIQNALVLAEKTKQTQKIWFFSIGILFIVSIGIIIWIRMRKNKVIRDKISQLNRIANIQIATMEEISFQAVKNEQIRLGQDLHNTTASSLAVIKHQIELLLLESNTANYKSQLTKVLTLVEDVYNFTRNKSHEWFSLSDKKAEALFYQQIHTNLEMIFSSPRYNKTIEIDQDVLQDINSTYKIELLKIIQEALTNIIKHSKAKNISLFLYRENDDSLSLVIKNDGNLHIKNQRNGLGLKSIISKISKMNGTVKISTDDGFEILINIPLN